MHPPRQYLSMYIVVLEVWLIVISILLLPAKTSRTAVRDFTPFPVIDDDNDE
jgi:hypothetical protein